MAPRTPAAPAVAAAPYVAPTRREGAGAATLAGCALAYPSAQPRLVAPAAYAPAAPYVPAQRRTAEQQAAAAAAGRPNRVRAFPSLTARPLPQPVAEAPRPLHRLALLFPSQRVACLLPLCTAAPSSAFTRLLCRAHCLVRACSASLSIHTFIHYLSFVLCVHLHL